MKNAIVVNRRSEYDSRSYKMTIVVSQIESVSAQDSRDIRSSLRTKSGDTYVLADEYETVLRLIELAEQNADNKD